MGATPFLSAVPTGQHYADDECTKSVLSAHQHSDVPASNTPMTDLIQKSRDVSHFEWSSDRQSSSQRGLHNPGIASAKFGMSVGTSRSLGPPSHGYFNNNEVLMVMVSWTMIE